MAKEFAANSDKLYDAVQKCLDIQRVNLKLFVTANFVDNQNSLLALTPKFDKNIKEETTKISRNKVIVKDIGDDYVEIFYESRYPHLKNSLRVNFMYENQR